MSPVSDCMLGSIAWSKLVSENLKESAQFELAAPILQLTVLQSVVWIRSIIVRSVH